MIGHDAIVRARIAGNRLDHVDMMMAPKPEADSLDLVVNSLFGPIVGECWVTPEDAIATLDLRFCIGLRVNVYASEYERGLALFARISEFKPAVVNLIHPESVVSFSEDKVQEWAL